MPCGTLILIVVLAVMNGCSTNAEVPAETVATEEPVEEERLTDSIGGGDWYGWLGQATLEEMVVASPIIVRGRLASVTPVGVRSRLSLNGTIPGAMYLEGYQGSLEFTFDVLEYLKGSGGGPGDGRRLRPCTQPHRYPRRSGGRGPPAVGFTR